MDWTMGAFIEEACARVRKQVGDQKVVLGLSGGVDSSVTAALLHKAIGDQLTCIFVNNGLLRAREEEVVQRVFGENFHVRLKYVDASERFLSKLRGLTDPEQKRKVIGNEFIKVFEDAVIELATESNPRSPSQNSQFRFLAQGTLYPDVIESVAIGGNPAHGAGGRCTRRFQAGAPSRDSEIGEAANSDQGYLPGGQRCFPGAAVQRDAPSASAQPVGDGVPLHRGRAAAS